MKTKGAKDVDADPQPFQHTASHAQNRLDIFWMRYIAGQHDGAAAGGDRSDVGRGESQLDDALDGVNVELSTVEIDVGDDTGECVGAGPWVHFDVVPCGAFSVPTVALELRFVTEVARQRTDRWEPIAAYFR